jgi:hypothetical protein
MSIRQYLERWKTTGAITGAQHVALSALVRKDRFSVFLELNTLLYLGVVSFVAGVGWTIRTYFVDLGDAAILTSLTLVFGSSLYYCFSRSLPYSQGLIETPSFVFDYVLYLGCLIFGVGLGYLEFRFHFLKENWDHYLLLSSVLYFALAYRLDNRFVLSLGLSTLAGWFGLRLWHLSMSSGSLRLYALAYAAVVSVGGTGLHRAGIKKHFLEAYLHIAANVSFVAVVSAVFERDHEWLYLTGLAGLAAIAIVQGVRSNRFAFVVYGVVYGYIGISARAMRDIDSSMDALFYVATSGTVVIVTLVMLARRFGREE